MDKNIFRIPSAKFMPLYETFNPRVVFLVNLTKKKIDDIFSKEIKFREDVLVENLEAKPKNFSIKAPIKSNTIYHLTHYTPDLEKIAGVEEIFSIFLICNTEVDKSKIKEYTGYYRDRTVGIIIL
jgi:hypothetical protein